MDTFFVKELSFIIFSTRERAHKKNIGAWSGIGMCPARDPQDGSFLYFAEKDMLSFHCFDGLFYSLLRPQIVITKTLNAKK